MLEWGVIVVYRIVNRLPQTNFLYYLCLAASVSRGCRTVEQCSCRKRKVKLSNFISFLIGVHIHWIRMDWICCCNKKQYHFKNSFYYCARDRLSLYCFLARFLSLLYYKDKNRREKYYRFCWQ